MRFAMVDQPRQWPILQEYLSLPVTPDSCTVCECLHSITPLLPTVMASFSDSPVEVAAEIIEALQDDSAALKACSLTCRSLLPLCRAFIFRSIKFTPRSFTARRQNLPRRIILFGRLLDNNPSISDYVQNLVYQIQSQDFSDNDVPRILTQFRRLQSFCLIGGNAVWDTLRQPFRESLLRIIRLPSITSLEISYFRVFPITLFSLCLNLTTLVLTQIDNDSMDEYQQEYPILEVSQLSSFTFGVSVAKYVGRLVSANRSNGLPVLGFHNVRSLSVNVDKYSDLPAVHALLKVTDKLETLEYIVDDLPDGFRDLAASMNPASLSTLRKIEFEFDINDDIQHPLCGVSTELRDFSGINRLEEIILHILVQTDCRCKIGDQWGELDAALATGFPMLKRVSVNIIISTYASYSNGVALKEELDRLPEDQFPWLSSSLTVSFDFSTEVNRV